MPDLADEDEIDISLTATDYGFGHLKSWAHLFVICSEPKRLDFFSVLTKTFDFGSGNGGI